MTRDDYTARFATLDAAIEYEAQVLSIGSELLPACARVVRDGGETTGEYWAWLCGQLDAAEEI